MENIKAIENSNGIITLELTEGIKVKFILENFDYSYFLKFSRPLFKKSKYAGTSSL